MVELVYELQDPALILHYACLESRPIGLRHLARFVVAVIVVSLFAVTVTFLAEQSVAEWVCGLQMIDTQGSCGHLPK
jgi:hypothetical protein